MSCLHGNYKWTYCGTTAAPGVPAPYGERNVEGGHHVNGLFEHVEENFIKNLGTFTQKFRLVQ